MVLLLISALSMLIGVEYTGSTAFAFEKFWKMIVFVIFLTQLASTRRNFRLTLWALVVGSLYIGYDAFTAPPSTFAYGRLELVGGPDFFTTSGTAAHLSAMLPLIGTAFLISKSWTWRLCALISGALACNAIIMCRTRSAFVGMAMGVVAAFVMAEP